LVLFLVIALPIAVELVVLAGPVVLAWRWRRVVGIALSLIVIFVYSWRVHAILVAVENHVD
jgi:hypothetical protein